MKDKEFAAIGTLTVLIAFMDISGLPCSLFVHIEILDIDPFYWTLILNFIVIGIVALCTLKYRYPWWELGLTKKGLKAGLKEYGFAGIIVGIVSGIAFYIGLRPFDYKPTIWKVLVEGILYYLGVAFVEELYVRGLLLNLLEKLFAKHTNKTAIAVILSSVIFGLGHIFGTLGQPLPVMIAKVIWTISMGMYFGAIYKKTSSLWLPIILHFFIDICALPYCFTTMRGYSNVSLCIILPTYIILGMYSLKIMKGGA